MIRKIVLFGPLFALTACGQGANDDELMPGNWKISAGMTDFEVPGATAEQAKMFQGAVGQTTSQEQCITESQAQMGPETMTQAFKQGGDCKDGTFSTEGGTISGNMSCVMPDGTAADMAIAGTIEPEKFTMTMTTEMTQEMLPGGKANVTMEVTGERLGEC